MTERHSNEDRWFAEIVKDRVGDDHGGDRATFRLALARAASGDVHTALQMLGRVHAQGHPDLAARAAFERMLMLRHLRDDDGAQRVLAEADALADPELTPDVKINVGLAWQQLGELERAGHAYQAVLRALAPQTSRSTLTDALRTAVALAAYRLGQLAIRRSELSEAERLWRQALAAGDEDISPHAALDLADMLSHELAPAEVEELLRLAIDYDHPDVSPRAALVLARFLRNRWQSGPAEDLYREVAESGHPHVAERAALELRELQVAAMERSVTHRKTVLPRRTSQLPLLLSERDPRTRVVIVGAGTGGQYLRQSMERRPYEVIGFVDDDAERLAEAGDLHMLGTISDLAQVLAAAEVDEVHMAIPTAAGSVRAYVAAACREARVPLLNLPSMYELIHSRPLVNQLRPVRIEETLGHEGTTVDRAAATWLRGKSVVVIGAAGSLGSELSRRLAQARVKHLVMVDRDQPSLRALTSELSDQREFRGCFPVVADCGNQNRMDEILRLYEAEVVFHSASYADPAFVETNPIEAAANGPVALARVLRAAGQRKIARFIHVSSWHAAQQASLFGATKALCERAVVAAAAEYPASCFLSLRLGDVFRDRTSLIDAWERQIALGGPIETPEPGRRARLMTRHRAVELLLHGARVGESGEVLGTHAGTEVDLWELAQRFVELWGRDPERDVRVSGAAAACTCGADEAPAPTVPHPAHAELVTVCDGETAPSVEGLIRRVREATRQRDAVLVERLLREAAVGAIGEADEPVDPAKIA